MEIEAESSDSFLHDLIGRRIILPRVPEDLADQKVDEDIFWRNNDAKNLEKKLGAANGLFIRHGMCMFIPAPSFHKIFLFKDLKIGKRGPSAITDKTIRDIGEVALHHLRKLDGQFEKLSDGGASVEKVEVDFVVYIIRKTNEIDQNSGSEDTFPNKWQANFDNFFEGKNFKNITCSCVCIHKSKVSEALVDGRKALNTGRNKLKTLAEKMLGTEIFGWEPSDEKFRVSGGEELKFSDSEKVEQIFTELFDSDRVHFLPDIDHLSDNLLSHIDDEGKVRHTGKLQLFYHEFVAHMKQKIPGVFIKDFRPHHIRNLFSWPYLGNYQIDWLFLGTDRIVVFEVGIIKDPENIKKAWNKKLKQVREHLMPFFKLILRAVDMSYSTDDKMNPNPSRWEYFWEFVKTKVTFVILLPNANSNAIRDYLNSRSESEREKILDPEVLVVCPEREHGDQNNFLAFNARGKAEPKQVTIDELLTKTIHEITSSTSSNDGEPMKYEKRLSLISKLLTLSFLSVVDDPFRPLDVNKRYAPDYQKVVRDCKSVLPSVKVNGRNLILTHEQHRLLQEDEKFLIIHGEAGSGKTSLLLMKALQLASDSNIGKVLYIIPEDKEELNKYLKLFLRDNEERLYEKFEICRFSVKSLRLKHRQILERQAGISEQLKSKIGEINTSVALLIDEFYYNAPLPFLFYPAAYCWVSYVTHDATNLTAISTEQMETFIDLAVDSRNWEVPVSKLCTPFADSLVKTDQLFPLDSESFRSLKENMRDSLSEVEIAKRGFEEAADFEALKLPRGTDFDEHHIWGGRLIRLWKRGFAIVLKNQIKKKFTDAYLHVLLRSSYHISNFAHDFIHKTKDVDASTALTVGTFVSSQPHIEVFRHDCGKATPSELFEAYFPKLNEKYSEPLIIVLASFWRMQMWNSFEVSERKCSISVVNFDRDTTESLNFMQFTGAEYTSVLLIVDLTEESEQLEQAFYAAVTRACYELVIVVDESLVELDRKIREVNEPLLIYHSLVNGDALPMLPNKESYLKVYKVLERTKDVQHVFLTESLQRSTGDVKAYVLAAVLAENLTKSSTGADLRNVLINDPICSSLLTLEPFKSVFKSSFKEFREALDSAQEIIQQLFDAQYIKSNVDNIHFYTVFWTQSAFFPPVLKYNNMRQLVQNCEKNTTLWSSVKHLFDVLLGLSLETKQMEHFQWSVKQLSEAGRLNSAVLRLSNASFINISEYEQPIDILELLIRHEVAWEDLLRNGSFIQAAVSKRNFVLATYLLEHDDRIDLDDKFDFTQQTDDLNREARVYFEARVEAAIKTASGLLRHQLEMIPLIGNLHKLTIEQHLRRQIRIQPDKAVQGELIMIDFPEMSVLGKRHLGIEIIDLENPILEEVLRKTNPHIKMLTDMVQINQPSHVSFLKPVTVTLPLHAKYKDWGKLETTDEFGRHIKIENGVAEISSFNFSPICLCYDEVKEAVAALVHRDQVDQMLHRRGVYLVVEQEIGPQNPAVLKFSFRPFFDFQEHERCRAARNVSFSRFRTFGPEDQLHQASISFKLKWDTNFITSYNGSLEENLEFMLGRIDNPQTWSHKKRREYLFAHNYGNVSKNLKIFVFGGDECNFSLKSSQELRDLEAEAKVFIPSLKDLFEYLNSNSPEWLAFMRDYLKIDKMKFCDFILKDLKEEVESIKRDENMNEQDFRNLQETITTEYRRHVENQIIEFLKSSVLGERSDGRLTKSNLYKLAEALRYVDGDKLKHALQAGLAVFDWRTILRTTSEEFKSWIGGDFYMSS